MTGSRRGAADRRRGASVDAFKAILAKDLRVELRTLQSVPAMALFGITTFVLFRFGLDRTTLSGSLAAGVLLATVLFAAILAINRLFVAERDEGGFDAIRLAPVDGTALGGAKAAALIVYLLILEAITLPVFAIFFLDSWSGLPVRTSAACARLRISPRCAASATGDTVCCACRNAVTPIARAKAERIRRGDIGADSKNSSTSGVETNQEILVDPRRRYRLDRQRELARAVAEALHVVHAELVHERSASRSPSASRPAP